MAKPDPWLAIADPVDEVQPDQQGAGVAPVAPLADVPAAAPPAADQFAAMADPVEPNAPVDPNAPPAVNLVDATQTIGGFQDELPEEVRSQLKPEQLAEWRSMLKPGATAQQLADTMHRFGFNLENAEDVAKAINAGTPLNQNVEYKLPEVAPGDGAVGSFARGVGDTASLGTVGKLGAAAQAVNDVFNGRGNFGDRYDVNLDFEHSLEGHDESSHPYARIAGQLVGGMVLPSDVAAVAAREGALALRAARQAGHTFEESMKIGRVAAAKAATKRMTLEGATIGGSYGIGSSDSPEEALVNGVTGFVTGAAGGKVLGTVGETVAPRLAARAAAARALPVEPLTEAQQVGEAAARHGIDLLPADVGGPVTRRATSMTAQTIAGGKPIKDAAERMTEQAKAVRDRVAAKIGQVFQKEAAGNEGRAGAQKYIASSAAEARKFYGPAEAQTKGLAVPTPKAIAKLDEHIADFRETPGGAPGLATLEELRKGLASGHSTVAGIRRMRTVLRDQFISDGLTGSDLERRVGQVVDAAAEDVSDGLKAAGLSDAASLFRQGDAAWRKRAVTIDTAIKPLIGTPDKPKSGEQIIRTLTADLENNNARAVKFLRALPDKEQANVRASIIGALGKANKSGQDADGTAFSLSTFLSNWSQIGERAKAAYFGPEARAALNDLATVAQGAREAQTYANHSNTGGVVGNVLTLASGIGGVATFGKTVAVQYGLGRLLASPRFARWLARAPKTSLGHQAYVERLGRIARAEPAIATDVLALQKRLMDAFEPARLAAHGRTDSEEN